MRKHLSCLPLITVIAMPMAVLAHEVKQSGIEIDHPWSFSTPPGTTTGAGYFSVTNAGDIADRLVAARSERAERVEIHEMRIETDVMSMRPVDAAVEIAAGSTIEFRPGGYHLMLHGLASPFDAGETVPVTLTFEQAGDIEAGFAVRPLAGGAGCGGDAQHDDHHGH